LDVVDCRKTKRYGVQYKAQFVGGWNDWKANPSWQTSHTPLTKSGNSIDHTKKSWMYMLHPMVCLLSPTRKILDRGCYGGMIVVWDIFTTAPSKVQSCNAELERTNRLILKRS
jgi:hypothetical protein